ncbi:Crp/Fnr family transcriptional regulator (plasmid) [Aneurinibacillus sp. Ricciae_BoGa-3]|uniref:Crp/Fnr family transcriptional regulator n=1 Tax=Aneurinibacillus sp. Ricciae_BoGa-3 TaxID=3022697 RepID=UPI0023405A4E|nr:Crp/Fnr family transcriptional regulator [Aneurinibacillus sp. Ricciae_BoGa-3]WCK57232.1 Crp/Fnr family transcriptional regulator [Aneurinibacillus sp. Ricciae_BoGa-3]
MDIEQSLFLYGQLTTYELEKRLLPLSERRTIPKDTYILEQGRKSDEVYLILSGLVQIGALSLEGRELNMRLCTPFDIVGALGLFQNDVHHFYAKALDDVEVGVIPMEKFQQEIIADSELAVEIIKWLTLRVKSNKVKYIDVLLNGKKGEIYSTIIRLSQLFGIKTDNGIEIDYPITNQQLATYAGMSREKTNKLLKTLREKGIISINKNKITIQDIAFLFHEIRDH